MKYRVPVNAYHIIDPQLYGVNDIIISIFKDACNTKTFQKLYI